ncbi:hypothetical protein [Chryseobacterium nepalense]|uniref:Uncharacterized protein n=1 Tax=Chryseobacterium nepalense TaxID=1854498 RepID=A0ABY4K7R6_9FLAO|nr:hypothetical protein [Chryseobacterium nepalense]UPQ76789.1 hypothetical protein M0D58_04370 [Chryseobacterium nepalense]
MKKKYIIIILALLVVIGFLNIKIAYNFSPAYPLYGFILDIFKSQSISFNISNYPNNFFIIDMEILLSIVLFILTAFIKSSKYILYSSILLLIVWLKNMILFKGIIEQDIYLSTSILFLVSLVALNILNFYYKEKAIE